MRRSKRERGETLIESMTAMAIFTIAMLGILEMNVFAHTQLTLAGRETKAANIARDLIDAFDRLPYDSPVFADGQQSLTDPQFSNDADGSDPLVGAAAQIAALDVPAGTKVTWTSTADVDELGVQNGKVVQIFVTFPVSGAGSAKTIEFDTFKYNVQAMLGNTGAI